MNTEPTSESAVQTPPLLLLAAISAIQGELAVEGVGKTRRNQQQGYVYRGIDDVMEALSPKLAAHGVIINPRYSDLVRSERETAKGTTMIAVSVKCEVDFICVADGSRLTPCPSAYGEAFDSGDKATGKAQSYGYREVIVKTFCIPIHGTDGDTDSAEPPESRPAGQKRDYQMQPQKQFAPKPAAPKATDTDRIVWLLRQVQSFPEAATEVFREFNLVGPAEPYTAINAALVSGWNRDKWQALVAEVKQRAEQADDQLPGAEAPTPPTQVRRDPRTEQSDPDWWREVEIHFGQSKGVKLEELDTKKLYGWCLNWQPKEYQGAISPEDARLRRALDDAATHYNFGAGKQHDEI